MIAEGNGDWPVKLAEYIRHNDTALNVVNDKMLAFYQDDLLPAASLPEIIDVLGKN